MSLSWHSTLCLRKNAQTLKRYASKLSRLKDKKLIKSKPTRKLKQANSILDYFEYFCQMSSKLILKISRCTVSKFARFF